jgi:hypothetical protein
MDKFIAGMMIALFGFMLFVLFAFLFAVIACLSSRSGRRFGSTF